LIITIDDIIYPPYHQWLHDVSEWLIKDWGLDRIFSEKVAVLLLYNILEGNLVGVTSGFRSQARQRELRDLWDAGMREGLRSRPSLTSLHTITRFGSPNSNAIDMNFQNEERAGFLAPFFGLKWGGNFKNPDNIHFFT